MTLYMYVWYDSHTSKFKINYFSLFIFVNPAARVKTLEAMDDDQKLVLYGFFKQANVGDNNSGRPWAIQIVECKKW